MSRGRVRRRRAGRPARANRPTLRVQHASDLLALVPYLIGFHPEESIVVLLLKSDRIVVTMRTDLPPAAHYAEAGPQLAEYFGSIAQQQGADAIVLIGYSIDSLGVSRLLTATMDALPGLTVIDVYSVDGERWWSLTCSRSCCPIEGSPYDIESHPYAAEAVYAGLRAEPDRASLAATVRGPDLVDIPRLLGLVGAAYVRAGEQSAAQTGDRVRRQLSGAADPLDDLGCLELAVLVSDIGRRDYVWAMMTPEDAEQHIELWRTVVARVPPTWSAGPLGLLGVAAWISGHGALLNICGERLREQHPDYSLGSVLLGLSDAAIPPSRWMEMAEDMREELGVEPVESFTH